MQLKFSRILEFKRNELFKFSMNNPKQRCDLRKSFVTRKKNQFYFLAKIYRKKNSFFSQKFLKNKKIQKKNYKKTKFTIAKSKFAKVSLSLNGHLQAHSNRKYPWEFRKKTAEKRQTTSVSFLLTKKTECAQRTHTHNDQTDVRTIYSSLLFYIA